MATVLHISQVSNYYSAYEKWVTVISPRLLHFKSVVVMTRVTITTNVLLPKSSET